MRLHKNDKIELKVVYNTNEKSSAISWLKPEQTEGKKHPYMYTQSESIHSRSVAPFQDSPSIKTTYTAFVRVASKDIIPMLSANKTGVDVVDSEYVHKFDCSIPIPVYLIAIAAGNLKE
jgi:leukotriene-A4 hydrolase